MAVYVDRFSLPGRKFCAHMIADTREELDDMAVKIGLRKEYRQRSGTWQEHYDLTEIRRSRAIALGAVEVTSRELVKILRGKE